MGLYRLYTGSDNESHIETLEFLKASQTTETVPNAPVVIKEYPVGQAMDWHPAPRRQWVVILSGNVEIGLGDGTTHKFGPGDTRLVEDTSGRGHTTTTLGDVPCIVMIVPIK